MRKEAYLLLLLAPSAVIYACGGDSSTADGGLDATTDSPGTDAPGIDAAKDTGSGNDAGNDTGPQGDGSVSIQCAFPAECVDGGDLDAAYPPADSGVVCCATVNLSGSFPNCSFGSFSTACTAPSACASNVNLACSTDTLRACAHNSECKEATYNTCCYIPIDGGKAAACMSAAMISLLHPTCLDGG
jgi:hypothetical protein